MRIGIPTEVKEEEYRVAVTPAGAHALVAAGHEVLVQAGAGAGAGLPDAAYRDAGARLVPTAEDAWAADLVCKVKEPVPAEHHLLRRDQVLFTYLHLAASRTCTDALLAAGTTLSVYPVAQMVPIAVSAGVPVVIVNGEPTEMDRLADVVVVGELTEVLPALVARRE